MEKHLDKVLQPDGSYKWELVELRAENLYEKDKPALLPKPPKPLKLKLDYGRASHPGDTSGDS
jgi:hypothetical protein